MNTLTQQLNGHHPDQPKAGPLYESSNIINVTPEGRIVSIFTGAWALGNAISQVDKKPVSSLLKLLGAGYLLYRGISGNCIINGFTGKRKVDKHTAAVNIRTSLIINNPKEEVYYFWRQLNNLPVFMKHLQSVEELDPFHSHWIVKGPGRIGTLEWDAEIVKEIPGELLGWRSLPGSSIATACRVTFRETVNGDTEIDVMITYRPPAGYVGTGMAWLLNPAFENMIIKDIKRFKVYMETGEILN
ncbi:putative membrane protein [Chitinophaga niastensis]|uniref:Putative membrane protein n=1 Tax=Chitinophaga niastensis TaxID=536980 RepID=A0A2P8HPB1_CHINA|nr:SRPBCC family protein [Chitinophaga niastensis]PSL48060.1 putative membrane protein [Chitinophaga niastensis]